MLQKQCNAIQSNAIAQPCNNLMQYDTAQQFTMHFDTRTFKDHVLRPWAWKGKI